MQSILFVDDTPAILNVYKRVFEKDKEWKCYFANDAETALDILETYTIDIIVTDLEMPHLNGAQLLQLVKMDYPSIVRIIISGATMTDMHFRTVRLCHRFFRKPTNFNTIHEAIAHTFFVMNLLINKEARTILGDIENIPSYPFVIDALEKQLASPDCSLKEVSKLITSDAGLTSSILKFINSDYFTLSEEIVSIEHAVSLIGIKGIEGVILTNSMLEEMPINLYNSFNMDHFREHSMLTARFAKEIALYEKWPQEKVEICFLTGLLHDIGRILLDINFPDIEMNIQSYLKETNGASELATLERSNIGVSHPQAGAYILGLWGIKNEVIEPIILHHSPSDAKQCNYPKIVAVLHCADQFAYTLCPKYPIDGIEKLDRLFINQHLSFEKVEEWREVCKALFKDGPLS